MCPTATLCPILHILLFTRCILETICITIFNYNIFITIKGYMIIKGIIIEFTFAVHIFFRNHSVWKVNLAYVAEDEKILRLREMVTRCEQEYPTTHMLNSISHIICIFVYKRVNWEEKHCKPLIGNSYFTCNVDEQKKWA